MTKYVFVTGGVVSSLGKGIAAASLAAILESRGIRVTIVSSGARSSADDRCTSGASSGVGSTPIVSSDARRMNSASFAGGEGGRFRLASFSLTWSSMKFRRGAWANVSGGNWFAYGETTLGTQATSGLDAGDPARTAGVMLDAA